MPFEDTDLDALLFFGREYERDVVASNLMASRLTVLYGASGVGKSSLLRAGVAHQLRSEAGERGGIPEYAVVVFGSWRDDPVRPLAEAAATTVAAIVGGPPDPAPVEQRLADALALSTTFLGGELYVILDQIDEYFLYHGRSAEAGGFVEEFAEAVARPDLRVNFLLSIREDALAKLDVFKGRIPNLFANYLRLDHLGRRAARSAIVGPAERYNQLVRGADKVELEPELVETVLDQTAAGSVALGHAGRGVARSDRDESLVEAPYLQLVMQRIWEVESEHGPRTLRLETLEQLGGAEEIVRAHLERALEGLSATEKDVAANVFEHLVTPSGTKIAHGVDDLAGYASVPEDDLVPILSTLGRERILRPVAGDGHAARYEIFHDVLAQAVLSWRTGYEARRELDRVKAESRRRQRRILAIVVASLIALVAMAGVTVFALAQREFALDQRGEAREQAVIARARELTARAGSLLRTDPDESIRLGLTAARLAPTPQAEEALRDALIASRVRRILRLEGGTAPVATYSGDGRLLVVAGDGGEARIFRATGEPVSTVPVGSAVHSAVLSPDGTRLATASQDGTARVWDVKTGRRLHDLRHARPVNALAFAPDGSLLVTASSDRTARIWRADTGEIVATLQHESPVRKVSFGVGGRLFVTVSDDTRARVFDVDGRSRLVFDQGARLTDASFSPNGKWLATAGANKKAIVWDLQSGRPLYELRGHVGRVVAVAFDPRGRFFATASTDGTGRVWDARRGSSLSILVGHGSPLTDVAFSPNGFSVVTASRDRTARVWKPSTGAQRALLAGHRESVTSAAFSPNGRAVLTASEDGTARVWDPEAEPELRVLARHRGRAVGADIAPGGDLVVSAGTDGTARVVELASGRTRNVLRAGGPLASASFDAAGRLVATAGRAGGTLWRPGGGTSPAAFPGTGPLRRASFDPGGTRVVTAGEDGLARVWAVTSGRLRETLRGHAGPVVDARFSPDGARVVTAGTDRTAWVWNVTDGRRLHLLRGHGDALTSASFSPDGRLVLTTSADGTAVLWRAADGSRIHELRGHENEVLSGAFSTDGALVVTASLDHDARIWETASGRLVHVLRGHFAVVSDAEFSRDGRWVVTAGPVTAAIWNVSSGQRLFYLGGHTARLRTATFAPNGFRVVTAADDGTVRTYACDVCGDLGDLVGLARRRLAALERQP